MALLWGPQGPLKQTVSSLPAWVLDLPGAGSSSDVGSLLAFLLCVKHLLCVGVSVHRVQWEATLSLPTSAHLAQGGGAWSGVGSNKGLTCVLKKIQLSRF